MMSNVESEYRKLLTPREREAMDLLVTGLPNREIGEKMGCGAETVKKHLKHCYAKLGFKTRTKAAIFWLQQPPGPHGKRVRLTEGAGAE